MKRFHWLIPVLILAATQVFAEVQNVGAWAYQLQNAEPAQIAANNSFDLIVMDQSRTGGPDGYYTPAEIASITNSGKIPVCYLSIGEAENYRAYWRPEWNTTPPAWLGPENPDWPGNFSVRFWDPAWQAIVFDNIRSIEAQGFGGLYLDIVDGYYYWSEVVSENPTADRDMAQFVIAIGDSMRSQGGGQQLLIPQNGEYIVWEDDVVGPLAAQYFNAIDAIGIEDVFFFGDLDENNPWNPDSERLQALENYRQRGITVFSVEYLTDAALIQQYRQAASDADFIPYTSVRALDVLTDGMAVSAAPDPEQGGQHLTVFAFAQGRSSWNFRIHSDGGGGGIQVNVYDVRGNREAEGSGTICAGRNDFMMPMSHSAASGMYFYRVARDWGKTVTGKILLIN